jgi:hypothetical protein
VKALKAAYRGKPTGVGSTQPATPSRKKNSD